MKRILAFTLVFVLALSALVTVSAEDRSLEDRFLAFCNDILPEQYKPDEDDEVKIFCSQEIDGLTYFIARCMWLEVDYSHGISTELGSCRLVAPYCSGPNEFELYVSDGVEIYPIVQAYSKGIITDVSVLKPYFSEYIRFYPSQVSDPSYRKYEHMVFAKHPELEGKPDTEVYYREVYDYTSFYYHIDQTLPDYVVVSLLTNEASPAPVATLFGDYVLYDENGYTPYNYGLAVYFPKEDRLVSIEAAYKENPELIMHAFTEGGVGELIGDMDNDRKITVKDATFIQKCLVDLETFPENDDIEAFRSCR